MKENISKIGAKSHNSNDTDTMQPLSENANNITTADIFADEVDNHKGAKSTLGNDTLSENDSVAKTNNEVDGDLISNTNDADTETTFETTTYTADINGDVVIPPELKQKVEKLPKYSASEERINVITHAFGAIVSVVAALSMLIISIKDFTVVRLIGSLVFGVSLIYLYVNSTLYHNEQNPIKRITRQKLDHSSINVLIAGSNTFFLVTGLHSNLGYILCAVNWGLSIISMILNAINVKKFRAPTMVIYILTGWLSIFFAHIILAAIGTAFWVLLAGGLFYTFGLIFYAIKKPYMHAVWHFFVLGGSLSHIAAAFMILATV